MKLSSRPPLALRQPPALSLRDLVRPRPSLFLGAGLLLGGLTGCSNSEVAFTRWDPLEEEEVIQALGEPSGEFREQPDADVVRQVEQRLPGLIEVARFMGHVATVVTDVSNSEPEDADELPDVEEGPEPDEESSWGTSLYVKVACPGDSLQPPFSFENGEVRLDSPEIKGLDLTPLTEEGQFLLSFKECQIGDLSLSAEIPGRYFVDTTNLMVSVGADSPDYPRHILALDVKNADEDSPIGVAAFACGTQALPCDRDVRVAAEIDTGETGTYVVAMRLTQDYWRTRSELSVTIKGDNSTSSCTASTGDYPTLSCASE